jgi:16S rRNA processing protein RimM
MSTWSLSPGQVAIGAIVRAHGVRGWLRIRAFHPDSPSLAAARRLLVVAPGGQIVERAVERCERERQEWLVKLRGVDDRDGAEALCGHQVALPRAELPAAGDDELYVADLVGCALVHTDGRALGTVTSVVNYGAQELLLVALAGGGPEAMVPFVAPIVVSVDLAARRIICDPPEGLLELGGEAAGGPPPGEGADDDERGGGAR